MLSKGSKVLRFSHKSEGNERGFSIRDFSLTPVSGEVSQLPAKRGHEAAARLSGVFYDAPSPA